MMSTVWKPIWIRKIQILSVTVESISTSKQVLSIFVRDIMTRHWVDLFLSIRHFPASIGTYIVINVGDEEYKYDILTGKKIEDSSIPVDSSEPGV